MRTLIVSAVIASSAVLVGCASTPSVPSPSAAAIPLPTPDVPTANELERLAESGDADTLKALIERHPEALVPTAERVRFIQTDEYAAVMASCLTSEGFPSAASDSGGVESEFNTTEQEAFDIASYVCGIKFPGDPKYLVPLNSSQITYIYNYQTKVLTPCLKAAGIEVASPPSLETFLASYAIDGGGWSPYANVTGSALWASINKQCPQLPPHLHDSPK